MSHTFVSSVTFLVQLGKASSAGDISTSFNAFIAFIISSFEVSNIVGRYFRSFVLIGAAIGVKFVAEH